MTYQGCRHYQIEALIVAAMAAKGESILTALNGRVATSVARVTPLERKRAA